MAGWDEILLEINTTPGPQDTVRKKYLEQLQKHTGRNVIAYYSSWLTKQTCDNVIIDDSDMSGFMNAIKGLDCSKGLDLILHTPGGSPVAAEAIVKYLRKKFGGNIRVIVPQLAMSAGTMIACAGKEIIMGKHSSLGPIDPQFTGIPAYNVKKEFEDAKANLSNHPEDMAYWSIILGKYPLGFYQVATDAIELSTTLAKEWLGSCMFDANNTDDIKTIDSIVMSLNEHDNSKEHGRHFDIEFCEQIGLQIVRLEDDSLLQELVLSVHHAYILTLSGTTTVKIIENHDGKAQIISTQK